MSELILDRVERVLIAWSNYEKRKTGPARSELKASIDSLRQAVEMEMGEK